MSGASSIEWTDATWSPVVGCTRVSAGCDHCYAATMTRRLEAMGQEKYKGLSGRGHFNGVARLHAPSLDWPLRWRGAKAAKAEGRPSRIFVNPMSDLFHERLSDADIAAVFGVMAACPQHVFQVLTKRPERMRRWFEWAEIDEGHHSAATLCAMFAGRHVGAIRVGGLVPPWPLPNVWLGVSVEDQKTADERIPLLLQCLAAVRFVSAEPLLGPVDLSKWLEGDRANERGGAVLSCAGSDRRLLDGRDRSDVEASSADRREPNGSASLLESDPEPQSGHFELGRLPDGPLFGREDSPQGVRASRGLDAGEPSGHSAGNAGEPQERGSDGLSIDESGAGYSVGELGALGSSARESSEGAPWRKQLVGEAHGESGEDNPVTGRQDGAKPDRQNVWGQAGDCFGDSPPKELVAHLDERIDWLIVGGESGPGARPFDLAWARSAVAQCREAGVACFVKQLGARPYEEGCEPGHVWIGSNPASLQRLRDRKGGDWSEWPEDLRVREMPV